MIGIDKWGPFLRGLIKQGGYEQKDVARHIGMSAQNFSTRLKDDDVKIKMVLGVLDYIGSDIISVLYTPDEIKNYLPPYLTEDDIAIMRTLNEDIPEDRRNRIKQIFFDLLNV